MNNRDSIHNRFNAVDWQKVSTILDLQKAVKGIKILSPQELLPFCQCIIRSFEAERERVHKEAGFVRYSVKGLKQREDTINQLEETILDIINRSTEAFRREFEVEKLKKYLAKMKSLFRQEVEREIDEISSRIG